MLDPNRNLYGRNVFGATAAKGRRRMYAAASNMLNDAFGYFPRRSLERQNPDDASAGVFW